MLEFAPFGAPANWTGPDVSRSARPAAGRGSQDGDVADTTRRADFVVVGSGVAGLRAAIELTEAWERVLLLTKDAASDSSSDWAQGGIAAALSGEDRIGLHEEDTLKAGAGLSEEAAVRILVEAGPAEIVRLLDWGADFDRDGIGLAFTREAAHSIRRVLHAGGDATGREIVRVLLAKASTFPNLEMVPRCAARDLIVEDGVCRGIVYLDEASGEEVEVAARAVLLATGGAGRVYRHNTNPPQATGDGLAMGWLAGAELMDLEFVQFHPTTLCIPGAPRWLLTEALRGEGGILRDLRGRRFMPDHHPDAELAPRDVVSRGIVRELARSDDAHVLLDLTHLGAAFLRDRFPGIDALCRRHHLDFTRELIPVRPAAHYFMGGVRTDLRGRTSIQGLYAAGEVACCGIHGANRLASNSLLDGLVFGARAAEAMLQEAPRTPLGALPRMREPAFADDDAAEITSRVETLAWDALGLERHASALAAAEQELARVRERLHRGGGGRAAVEARNRWVVGGGGARTPSRRTGRSKKLGGGDDGPPPRRSLARGEPRGSLPDGFPRPGRRPVPRALRPAAGRDGARRRGGLRAVQRISMKQRSHRERVRKCAALLTVERSRSAPRSSTSEGSSL
jgi:L-aspartate oxidase